MWQKEKKDSSVLSLALLLTLATIPMAATVTMLQSALAQSAPNVPLSSPVSTNVPTGTTVRIDGSSSMAAINQTLKQRFEKQFSGTKVEIAAHGTDAALKALQNGNVDVAAISRELTPEEEAQGLKQVLLHREKIAIVVGADNPFQGSLTVKRFAKIFRGEIRDWSQVGGPEGKIRVIDRPTTSDTREAFREYPVFQAAEFATGSTALQLDEDNIPEIVKQLGKDGITYILANEVPKLQGVRVLRMNHILPEDSRYPFSQASVYVYKKKNPGPSVINFLDFATAPVGKQAIEEATAAEAVAIASGLSGTIATATNTPTTTETATSTITPTPSATPLPSTRTVNKATAFHKRTSSDNQSFLTSINQNGTESGLTPLLWWLLPLFAFGGFLLWWLKGRRPSGQEQIDNLVQSTSLMPLNQASATEMSNLSIALTISKAEDHTSSKVVEKPSQTTSHLVDTTSSVSNQGANPTKAGASALTDGAVLTVSATSPLWAKFFERGSDGETNNNTKQTNNTTEVTLPKSGEVASHVQPEVAQVTASSLEKPNVPEVAFDLEAPVTVANSVNSELPDVPITSNVKPEVTEVTSSPKQLDVPVASILAAPVTIVSTSTPKLTNVPEVAPSIEPKATEVQASSIKLPDFSEVALDMVADAAEPTAEITSHPPRETTEVAPSTGIISGATIDGTRENTKLDVKSSTTTTDKPAPVVDAGSVESLKGDFEKKIILTSRTPKWAYAFWQVSETEKEALRHSGGSQLVLRLYDVTHIDLSYQSPQLIQQYECEETVHDRYVAIPKSDRDYMAEIGYATNDDSWLLLARSAITHVLSRPDQDFWFVADAELIIHGAAEPGSTVNLEGHPIKLKPDGTFHLRIPFTHSLIDYTMTAVAANGEQAKTIHMHFSQDPPEPSTLPTQQ